jgi:glycosyltransferase involved in cell wall biosynthesis
MGDAPLVSFVLPVYNESETLPTLRARLASFIDGLDGTSEVILIDDGSKDDSYQQMVAIADSDPRFRTLRLSRNFGHQVAITAGIDAARGAAVIVMDADLQDPPDVVHRMLAKWREGYGVVYGRRVAREGETAFKKLTASLFYRLLRRLSEVDIPTDVGDFRLMDRKVVDAFKEMREQNRYVRGMVAWMGFDQCAVDYIREERFAGETKYPLKKMLSLAANGIVGFSNVPLRLILGLGLVVAGGSFAVGLMAIIAKMAGFFVVPGWTSLALAVSGLSGVQLIVLGVVGEYVGRIHDEVKHRPLYLVRDSRGFGAGRVVVPADAASIGARR